MKKLLAMWVTVLVLSPLGYSAYAAPQHGSTSIDLPLSTCGSSRSPTPADLPASFLEQQGAPFSEIADRFKASDLVDDL